jgi:hypothetical protein
MRIGHSSVWMLPIYGLASINGDIYPKIAKFPKLLRAFLYGLCFLIVGFMSGMLYEHILRKGLQGPFLT